MQTERFGRLPVGPAAFTRGFVAALSPSGLITMKQDDAACERSAEITWSTTSRHGDATHEKAPDGGARQRGWGTGSDLLVSGRRGLLTLRRELWFARHGSFNIVTETSRNPMTGSWNQGRRFLALMLVVAVFARHSSFQVGINIQQ